MKRKMFDCEGERQKTIKKERDRQRDDREKLEVLERER